jgi:hypothetical protein
VLNYLPPGSRFSIDIALRRSPSNRAAPQATSVEGSPYIIIPIAVPLLFDHTSLSIARSWADPHTVRVSHYHSHNDDYSTSAAYQHDTAVH